MRCARRSGAEADDDGVTLIELIVYVLLAALFLGLMTGLFITGWQSQAATTERDSLTGGAAVANETLQTGIRSASWFSAADDGTTLRARVLIDGGSECRAWVVTREGDLLYRTASRSIDVDPALDAPAGDAPAGWVSLVHRESVDDRAPVQVVGEFEEVGRELRYRLTLSSQGEQVPLVGGSTASGAGGGAPC